MSCVRTLLMCKDATAPSNVLPEKRYLVSENVMEKITGQPNPEGIAAEVAVPDSVDLGQAKRWIALDQVSDPGNVGSLLRTALALGWGGAFLVDGCADPFSERALRSSMGAAFRLPLQFGSAEQVIETAGTKTMAIADMKGEPIGQCQADDLVLVLGNESHGVGETLRAAATMSVAIEMGEEMESLGVAAAGAIALYLLGGAR